MNTTPEWRKSSRSGQGNNCVEVATNIPARALVRDSKLGLASPVLDMRPANFARFIEAVKADRFE